MTLLNKTLKMTVFNLLIITFLTHVIAHALQKFDLVEFIKGNLRVLKED